MMYPIVPPDDEAKQRLIQRLMGSRVGRGARAAVGQGFGRGRMAGRPQGFAGALAGGLAGRSGMMLPMQRGPQMQGPTSDQVGEYAGPTPSPGLGFIPPPPGMFGGPGPGLAGGGPSAMGPGPFFSPQTIYYPPDFLAQLAGYGGVGTRGTQAL